MIHLKTLAEIDLIALGGRIIGDLLQALPAKIEPGVTTQDLDEFCESFIRSTEGAVPAFQGLYGFPGAVCISLNEEVVHGIPSRECVLEEGDVVTVDVGVRFKGWCSDSAWTFPVGRIDSRTEELLDATRTALDHAIRAAVVGNHIGDIGAAVEGVIRGTGFGIIRDLVGHGVGRDVHEEPQVPNTGRPGQGPLLREGMVLAIEPMISGGAERTRTLEDRWTVVTSDGTRAAHFEHTVAITASGPRVLTTPEPVGAPTTA